MAQSETKSARSETANPGTDQPGGKDISSWKPGGEADQAKNLKASGDFGVPAGGGHELERDYVSQNTKRSEHNGAMPRSGDESEGTRVSGAGGDNSGPGSSSGGDIDATFVGVGSGGSTLSESGPSDRPLAADETDGSTDDYNSPVPQGRAGEVEIIPATGRNQTGVHQHGGTTKIAGSVLQSPDASAGDDAQGADAATNPAARGDDAFAGEISMGEASGQDNALRPSSDDPR